MRFLRHIFGKTAWPASPDERDAEELAQLRQAWDRVRQIDAELEAQRQRR